MKFNFFILIFSDEWHLETAGDGEEEEEATDHVYGRQKGLSRGESLPMLGCMVGVKEREEKIMMEAFPDTGSSVSIMGMKQLALCGYKMDANEGKYKLWNASGMRMMVEGTINILVRPVGASRDYEVFCLVSSEMDDSLLLSYRDMRRWGSIPASFPKACEVENDG